MNEEKSNKKDDGKLGVMKLNDHKAGMAGLDVTRINQIIEEASKGSKFYQHKQKTQERIDKKIADIKIACSKLTDEQRNTARLKMDQYAAKLERARDLSRTLVHVDMDAFYAAVEMRDAPHLKEKPMAVGSSSMLSTSNYHARRFGVRAAMPGFIAKKLCPELIIVPTNFPKYTEVSRQVQSVFADYDPEFSAASLDEAYLDISDYLIARPDMTAWMAVQEMRARILEKTQLTASAGIGPNGMLAKVCSDRNKPDGQFLLESNLEAVTEFIRPLPIRKISGIGNVTEQLLGAVGISTCGDLWEKRDLLYLLFSENSWEYFIRVALGIGCTDVSDGSERERKSVSCETTFKATNDREQLCDIVRRLSADLAEDVKRHGVTGRAVTLKYKTSDFDNRSRVVQLHEPTAEGSIIAKAAIRLLRAEPAEMHLRLLGVRLSQLLGTGSRKQQQQQQRTLDQLLFAPSSASKRRKLDDDVEDVGGSTTTGFHDGSTSAAITKPSSSSLSSSSSHFTCPVCQSWRSSTAEEKGLTELNRHVDECLNQQVLRQEPSTSSGRPAATGQQSKLDRFVIRRARTPPPSALPSSSKDSR